MKLYDYRRRKQLKTNYKKRFALLKSRLPRIVVRVTNTRFILQYVLHAPQGDQVKVTVGSQVLNKIGLKSYKNRLAGYLAGYYFGKIVIAKKLKKEGILDLGMQRAHSKGKLFSALKGMLDAGLVIPHSEEVLPTKEMILGGKTEKDLAEYLKKIDELKF